MEQESNSRGSIPHTKPIGFWLGAPVGFALGLIYGLLSRPPYEGMFQSASDVAGLTIASWLMLSLAGAICGLFIGPFIQWGVSLISKSRDNKC